MTEMNFIKLNQLCDSRGFNSQLTQLNVTMYVSERSNYCKVPTSQYLKKINSTLLQYRDHSIAFKIDTV